MDDRMQPLGDAWPVPLSTVLKALEVDDEVVLDLGLVGSLVVRRARAGVDSAAEDLPALSDRSRQVLALVAEGLPAAVVSEALGLPLPVVAHELTLLRERYGVDSTAAAVARARAVGDLD